jgi:RNA polymerase sigma-70 factor (ECF subfamily)
MTPERPLDPNIVADCHRDWRILLERYAWAILRDWSLAADAVQIAFFSLSRFGGDVEPNARKAWMFTTVHREALRIKSAESRHQSKAIESVRESTPRYEISPLAQLSSSEELQELQKKISRLPPEQKVIVNMRIVEDKTFGQIAEELQIPLGTALSRMRLALQRLRNASE